MKRMSAFIKKEKSGNRGKVRDLVKVEGEKEVWPRASFHMTDSDSCKLLVCKNTQASCLNESYTLVMLRLIWELQCS